MVLYNTTLTNKFLQTLRKPFTFCYSSRKLTQLKQGNAPLVVSHDANKPLTLRNSVATASVKIGGHLSELMLAEAIKKDDVLTAAQTAGMAAARKTFEIFPNCSARNDLLSAVKVTTRLDEQRGIVEILASVESKDTTGAELEALTAVSVSALTVYNMCKAVTKSIVISDVCLLNNSGVVNHDEVVELRNFNSKRGTEDFIPIVGIV
ncbi:unnamed protein product [Phyllotreta striolata]|uniref:Molybdopterin cofactor biosynthesis C (MoaC) domain-containing protein n=1 Tax=Phyllotreta striolata TaxID=444603 RepID=A0A9N9TPV3_PHYSR|nr:unnamed protein product [Phyllotreta striolata]